MYRSINKILRPKQVTDGDGVKLNRVFGYYDTNETDPFLMMDHFGNDDPEVKMNGFPWHPHRGIETITYMLKGGIKHEDSLGNKGELKDGDVQWMTAGSGIIHQEMGLPEAGNVYEGFQLWSNLPSDKKMISPRYQDINSQSIPNIKEDDGSTIKVITGEYKGVLGPVTGIVSDPTYLDVNMTPSSIKDFSIKSDKNVLIYIFRGQGELLTEKSKESIGLNNLLILSKGDTIKIKASSKGIRFLLLAGKPINEPIFWNGPIVMNTEEELQLAFEEYQKGIFTKHK